MPLHPHSLFQQFPANFPSLLASVGFPSSSTCKESTGSAGDPQFSSWVGKIRWRRERLPTPVLLGFPAGSAGREPTCNARDLSLIPGLGRAPGEGNIYPLQYSGLENSMDCIVHGVAKSRTRLGGFDRHWLPHLEPAAGLAWLPLNGTTGQGQVALTTPTLFFSCTILILVSFTMLLFSN